MFNKSCTHKCIQINSQENLPFVKTGADPEDNLLNEISQRKEISVWYHLDEKSKKMNQTPRAIRHVGQGRKGEKVQIFR